MQNKIFSIWEHDNPIWGHDNSICGHGNPIGGHDNPICFNLSDAVFVHFLRGLDNSEFIRENYFDPQNGSWSLQLDSPDNIAFSVPKRKKKHAILKNPLAFDIENVVLQSKTHSYSTQN